MRFRITLQLLIPVTLCPCCLTGSLMEGLFVRSVDSHQKRKNATLGNCKVVLFTCCVFLADLLTLSIGRCHSGSSWFSSELEAVKTASLRGQEVMLTLGLTLS